MASKAKGKQEDNLEVVEHALSSTEHFIEKNQKNITIALIVIVAVVGIFLGYKRFIVSPKEKDAKNEIFAAEQYFEKDSFNLALNGDGNNLGFLDVIDKYKSTKPGKLARYYAGISYLKLGKFQEAIDELKKFTLKDKLVKPMAIGAIGDAYVELGNNKEGISYYTKAARENSNSFTTPIFLMKAAELLEEGKEYGKAISLYEEIQKEYPESAEGRKIEKYIARAQAGLKN
ncbi:MAG TPA: tetratricopeptide repeat protein [Bacteroidales bacterium]|nr:tetratricopeptide repeat protein [Bacteroidales bacterium]